MAIYHFSAKVIGRAGGSSAVASAAYRSASRLHDERLGRDHDFTNKPGVIHSEVMLPESAPERFRATSVRLDQMSEAPALAIGLEEMVRQIKAAGDSARRDDHDALARARTALVQATRQISAYIVSERKGRDQDWWLAGTGLGGLVLGMLGSVRARGVISRCR